MRKNFLPFSCGARNTIYLQRSSKALPTTDTLDKKEDEFIAGGLGGWGAVEGHAVGPVTCGRVWWFTQLSNSLVAQPVQEWEWHGGEYRLPA